jgi:hypothetical protein
LIRPDQRFTVADHQQWQADLRASQAHPAPADELDDALADPMIERIARRRKNSEAARVLAILDSLKEGATEA